MKIRRGIYTGLAKPRVFFFKTQPGVFFGFYWVLLFFLGFIGFYWVLLGFFNFRPIKFFFSPVFGIANYFIAYNF
jgi:hypothetical protein